MAIQREITKPPVSPDLLSQMIRDRYAKASPGVQESQMGGAAFQYTGQRTRDNLKRHYRFDGSLPLTHAPPDSFGIQLDTLP